MIISLSAMLVRFALSNTGTFANRQYRTADLARRNLLFAVVWQGRRAIRLGVLLVAARKEIARPAGVFFSRRPMAPRPRSAGSNFAPPNLSMNFCASDCSLKQ